jgi:hypothetical protein
MSQEGVSNGVNGSGAPLQSSLLVRGLLQVRQADPCILTRRLAFHIKWHFLSSQWQALFTGRIMGEVSHVRIGPDTTFCRVLSEPF